MNVVALIGRLTTDVNVRELDEERRVADFLLSVSRAGSAGGSDVVRVTMWNRLADTVAGQLGKGERVRVDGRLRSRSWQDPDGKRRNAVEVVAGDVQVIGDLSDGEAEPAAAEPAFV